MNPPPPVTKHLIQSIPFRPRRELHHALEHRPVLFDGGPSARLSRCIFPCTVAHRFQTWFVHIYARLECSAERSDVVQRDVPADAQPIKIPPWRAIARDYDASGTERLGDDVAIILT